MTDPFGVNLLPATGEWVYDPVPHRVVSPNQPAPVITNVNASPGGSRTDYSIAIDQLQETYPGCQTVSLVVAWFGNSTDVTQCSIYPSSVYIGGTAEALTDGTWTPEDWVCSGLSLSSSGLIPISTVSGSAAYGGTPSDPSIVRCIQDLKSRGFRVTFYPFLLMDCAGYPWRGRITYTGADISAAAPAAVSNFFGTAALGQFTRENTKLTVGYAGNPLDFTYRRMILHYANLCVIAGGVDLFLLGSEFVGLEIIRGPQWTKTGMAATAVAASWDYPFVSGLCALATDVRSIFDSAGLTRDLVDQKNLISYSADWSVWMGVQHPDSSGQWPHLDMFYAHPDTDLISFDNYLPLSDWTTGDGGLDALNWLQPVPQQWPPAATAMNGLGLTTAPQIHDKAYLKANIEGGEKFSWFYANSSGGGRGQDPNGSDLQISLPLGDRLTQNRIPYAAGQQLLANKQIRWWWNNPHQAIYDVGDGGGEIPRGPPSAWVPQSKPVTFAEFGFPSCDRGTNQPNVFFDPRSSESATAFWSIWDPVAGAAYAPRRNDLLANLAIEAVVEYWTGDGKNETSAAGVPMVQPLFMSAWNWDARPFPAFPLLDIWGDAPNWATGSWIGGKGPAVAPPSPDSAPALPTLPVFPSLSGQSWPVKYTPVFGNRVAIHVSGRESRASVTGSALWVIELSFDMLSAGVVGDMAVLTGFYDSVAGAGGLFSFPVPAALNASGALICRFVDDQLDTEEFGSRLFASGSLKIKNIRF